MYSKNKFRHIEPWYVANELHKEFYMVFFYRCKFQLMNFFSTFIFHSNILGTDIQFCNHKRKHVMIIVVVPVK